MRLTQLRSNLGPKSALPQADDIRHKFLDCAEHGGVDSTRVERALHALTRLQQCPDANALVRPLIMA